MIKGVNSAVDNVKQRVENLRVKRALFMATKGTMVDVSKRVWGQGQLTDGSTLKYRDDTDLYAYTPPMPTKVTGKGKPFSLWKHPPRTKKGGIKAGANKIKGGWYKNYSALKQQQGRSNNPFLLTGRLLKAYFGGADIPNPTQDSDTEVTIRLRGEEAAKFKGLTEEKGPFLKLQPQEIEGHHKRLFEIYHEG